VAKSRKFKGSSVKRGNLIEMYGVSELLKSIEEAGGKVDEAVMKAVDKSLEIVGEDMQSFMSRHIESGATYKSYRVTKATTSKQVKVGNVAHDVKDGVTGDVGYSINKGGLPAIFLDVGTPKRKGHFFRYYAVENNRQKIHQIQRETLNEILEGLKK
jgi:HK97 gp10 family phage protein